MQSEGACPASTAPFFVWWFAPFIDKPFALASVPAVYHPWWLNFILHWSFMLEVAILIWAGWLWRRGTGSEEGVDRAGAKLKSGEN